MRAIRAFPLTLVLLASCSQPAPVRPSVLLVTLDTTRADAIGPGAAGIDTPSFNALAARGRLFRQAYATVPETLPSHSSMMTGLYPAGHGVHENARYLAEATPVLAERLRQAGYRTAAFVSSFPLARRFGLARGFDVYDDELPDAGIERSAKATTDAAIAALSNRQSAPLFIWVHYNDPHAPYAPPEPFRSKFPGKPYLAEISAMDEQLGGLVDTFEHKAPGPHAILVVADHGEGLGDHGEPQHGHLLYQSTMHVPLVLVGPGVTVGVSDAPVSTRRVYHTVLDWAGIDAAHSLRTNEPDAPLGEAMKPFLEYGWQPQVMIVDGTHKAIRAGAREEIYDVVADPAETRDLSGAAPLAQSARTALWDYPLPSPDQARAPEALTDDARRKLATLGYVSAGAAPVIRTDAPRPADMTRMLAVLEQASALFVSEQYEQVIPLLEKILTEDPHNLDATLRLATAHSALGHDARALEAFRTAETIAPNSPDVRTYLALHYAKGKDWPKAVPLLERLYEESPNRLPVIEALATVRERQNRPADALALRQHMFRLRPATGDELVRTGMLAMQIGRTPDAIDAFEQARRSQGAAFTHDLELGVLYLAARRLPDARDALDRVPSSHPDYPMALFKRAQVSVLLNEPDRATRIDLARRKADAMTRPLIASEKLFQNIRN